MSSLIFFGAVSPFHPPLIRLLLTMMNPVLRMNSFFGIACLEVKQCLIFNIAVRAHGEFYNIYPNYAELEHTVSDRRTTQNT